jgi:aspartate carbamoyltransferase catalytic subunit
VPATQARWTRKDLLDTEGLRREEVELILSTADAMAEIRRRPVGKVAALRGVTVATLFYEQSTRTRASFEVAAKALGADVVNLTAAGSSVEKGESLIDTVRTLESIGVDILVMRHPSAGAPAVAAKHASMSLINGGDGMHAHPTQALLDLYTMRKHLGSLAGRRVVIVGDILHSRVARSNLWLLLGEGAHVVFCGRRPCSLDTSSAAWRVPRTSTGAPTSKPQSAGRTSSWRSGCRRSVRNTGSSPRSATT